MSVYEANILVRIGLDSGTKRYARSDVIGDNFYEGRVVGFESISREISVLPRDIRISELVVSLDNTDQALSALAAAETFLQRDLTILMGVLGSGESSYEVRAKGRIFRTIFQQDVFEIRAGDELYFNLDEALAGARINPEYFPDLPEDSRESLVPLVIGDPVIRMPATLIDEAALRFVLAQGRIPSPTLHLIDQNGVVSELTSGVAFVRQSYGGRVLTLADVDADNIPANRQVFDVGDSVGSIDSPRWRGVAAAPFPIGSVLLPDPATPLWFSEIVFFTSIGSSAGKVAISISPNSTGAGTETGQDLTSEWESSPVAVKIVAGSLSLTVAGPDNSDLIPENTQEIMIGTPDTVTTGNLIWSDLSELIDAPFKDDPNATLYLRLLWLWKASTFGDTRFRTATTATGIPTSTGPEMSIQWEFAERAITLRAGSASLTLKGPDHPDNIDDDSTEPYDWKPDNPGEIDAFILAFNALSASEQAATTLTLSDQVVPIIDDMESYLWQPANMQEVRNFAVAYDALSDADKAGTVLTFDDGVTLPYSIEWDGPGITDTELEGGSTITNPVRQIEKLLKLQGFDRDATEISAAAAVAASKSLGGALVFTDAEETLRRALERIAESYNATVFLAADGAGIALPDPNAASPTIAAHLDPTNILQGGLQLANVEEVGSRIDYRFNFSPAAQEFLNADTDEDAASRTALGREIKHDTDMPFVRTSAVAAEIIDDRLALLEPGRLVGTIQVVPSLASSIDIGSVVSVTHFEGPGATGLNAAHFFVTGISLEAGADAVILTLTVVDLP